MFYVLEGAGRLRYGGEDCPLRAGDVVGCPTGPASAHQFVNDGSSYLVYLAISTVETVDACEYPDSEKVLGRAAGLDGQPGLRAVFRRALAVDYWDGEPLAAQPEQASVNRSQVTGRTGT